MVESGATPTVTVAPVGSGLAFPLASGHFVAAKGPMALVYPRPNAETNTWARHRKAYYDGVNAIEYRVPVGVRLGALPLRFSVLVGPPGLTIGAYWGDPNYGEVTWTPSAPVTNATVTIRVQDQANITPLDVTWTVTTSSSTADFIFADAVNGNDSTGTGTISAPYKTLSKLFGASTGTVTFPNTIAYCRGGTYTPVNQASRYMSMVSNASPMALLGYPGETVIFAMTAAGVTGNGTSFNDALLRDISFTGSPSVAEFWAIYMGSGLMSRRTFINLSFPNAQSGTASTNNNTSIYGDSTGGGMRQYCYMRGCSESGRSGGNSEGLFALFNEQNSLFEFNTVTASSTNLGCMYLKASAQDCTIRYSSVTQVNSADIALGTGCQVDAGIVTQNIEICYNTVNGPNQGDGAGSDPGTLCPNYGFFNPGTHWVYRNTVYGNLVARNSSGSNGPFILENNVVMARAGVTVVKTGTSITNSGTECQGSASAGIINTSTMLLIGTYRTNYLGLRGAEIA